MAEALMELYEMISPEAQRELFDFALFLALKGDLSGYFSRRIDDANRLVYAVKDGVLEIVACKSHYGDH